MVADGVQNDYYFYSFARISILSDNISHKN